MVAIVKERLTFEEFLNWDDGSGRSFELTNGVAMPLSEPTAKHEDVFYVSTEDSVEIEAIDGSVIVRGRIDVLGLQDQLWVLVIESKRAEFSPKVGIPQILSYMLAAPNAMLPRYGLVTNGTDFVFLKLVIQDVPRYGRSRQFILGQDNDLGRVLQILKHLAVVVAG